MKRFILALTILMTVTLEAQPMDPGEGEGGPMPGKRAMEMIAAMRIVRMREQLALNDQQMVTIMPKLSRRDSMTRAYFETQRKDLALLKQELLKKTPSQARLTEIMNRMKNTEQEQQDAMVKIRDEILSVLSVEQQAKFIVFEVEFEHEVRRMIDEVRGGRRGGEGER